MQNNLGPTSLNGVESLSNFSYTEILEQNLISFFDWGLINADGFLNITIPSSGAYGGDFSRLRPVKDMRFNDGQVWESARMNWVWETGLASSVQPIQISGLFVGSTFRPVSGGDYYIDYPNGRVIFNTAISQASVVRIEHSSKYINVTSTYNVPWLRITQTDSFRVDSSDFLAGSGIYANDGETRIQIPTIAIEVIDERNQGFQIGGGQYCRNRVNFFVITEEKNSVDRLSNIIKNQNEKTIYLYDSNRLATADKFPLNQYGTPISGFLTYPTLVQYSGDGGYRYTRGVLWGKLTFIEAEVQERQQLMQNVYQRSVSLRTESVLTNVA
jgi:hypothetical protein